MRTLEEVKAEIKRLEVHQVKKRMPQYRQVALWCRIESLKWAAGMPSAYDAEER